MVVVPFPFETFHHLRFGIFSQRKISSFKILFSKTGHEIPHYIPLDPLMYALVILCSVAKILYFHATTQFVPI